MGNGWAVALAALYFMAGHVHAGLVFHLPVNMRYSTVYPLVVLLITLALVAAWPLDLAVRLTLRCRR